MNKYFLMLMLSMSAYTVANEAAVPEKPAATAWTPGRKARWSCAAFVACTVSKLMAEDASRLHECEKRWFSGNQADIVARCERAIMRYDKIAEHAQVGMCITAGAIGFYSLKALYQGAQKKIRSLRGKS